MTHRRWTLLHGLLLSALLWAVVVGNAAAQEPGREPGAMPQSDVFRTTLLFARLLPFIIGLGIFAGLYRVRREAAGASTKLSEGAVQRHSWSDVGLHWLNAVGFLVGLGTAAMLLRWVERALDLQLIYTLHYVGSALIVYAVFNCVTHSLVGGHIELAPKLRDIPAALGELVSYSGIFGEPGVFGIRWPRSIATPIARLFVTFGIRKPKEVGKYLATEKVLSFPIWTLLAGLILVSGVVKMLRYAWPIPTQIVGLATWVHDLTTIAIAVWLVFHIAPTTLVPRNWPLFKSMFTSRVPIEYVKAYHLAWYRQLQSEELSRSSPGEERGLEAASQVGGD